MEMDASCIKNDILFARKVHHEALPNQQNLLGMAVRGPSNVECSDPIQYILFSFWQSNLPSICHGQHLAFLVQLPMGLPDITISVVQQKLFGAQQLTLHIKYSKCSGVQETFQWSWATGSLFSFSPVCPSQSQLFTYTIDYLFSL